MKVDLATSLLDAIHQVGVRHVFGIPGDAINGLVDAARRHEHVDFITVRHEEAGAFAASAQAKLTGNLAVVAGTAGPGAVHLLNGLYDAKLDAAPVLAITGQVPTSELGGDAHQEIDLARLFEDVAVFSEQIVDPEQMPRLAHDAIREAIVKRGVAHLILPSNLALADVEDNGGALSIPSFPEAGPARESLTAAAGLLDDAENVTLLVGIGARDAVDQVIDLAARVGAPIVKTLRAKHLIPDDHPFVIGGLGLLGTRPAVEAMDRTDLLVMVGTDFPYTDFYPDARCIQIDIDASRIGRRHAVDVGLVGSAGVTLTALLELLADDQRSSSHLDEAQEAMRAWVSDLGPSERDDVTPIRPQRLASAIGNVTPPGTIFLCDTGSVTAWCARHLALGPGDSFTLSASYASMAFALSGALGAQLAFPERPVVAITGDGGFTMLMGDLITAVNLDLPITVVIFDNSRLGLIQLEQEEEGLPMHAVDLVNPDLAAVARALGADAWRVEDPRDLEAALRQALASRGPAVVDVVIDPEEVLIPPTIGAGSAIGYARAKIREALGGDGLAGLASVARQAGERLTSN